MTELEFDRELMKIDRHKKACANQADRVLPVVTKELARYGCSVTHNGLVPHKRNLWSFHFEGKVKGVMTLNIDRIINMDDLVIPRYVAKRVVETRELYGQQWT